MNRKHPRRNLVPRINPLEDRRLLALSAQYLGLSGLDVAGPTAAIGPGGDQNLHVQIAIPISGNSSPALKYLQIAGPTGFQWTFGTTGPGSSNPQANASIAVAAGTVASDGKSELFDAYFSPVVAVVDPTTGATSFPTLPNNQALAITVAYSDASGTLTTTSASSDPALIVTPNDLTQPLADPSPTLPNVTIGTYAGSYQGQTADGNAHLQISGLPSNAPINPATAELSDVAGLYWNTGSTYGRGELGMTIAQAQGATTADIAFPPERDETGSTLTFRFQLANSPNWYVTDVALGASQHTDPNLRDGGPVDPTTTPFVVTPTATLNMVGYTDSNGRPQTMDFQQLLDSGHPVVTLATGTYNLGETLTIHSGMILQGASSNVELNFVGLPAVPEGVINFHASHITLNQFKIRFADPRVDFTGGNSAIISDEEEGGQRSRVDLNVTNLDIQAPSNSAAPLLDGVPLAIPTTYMDYYDSGTIQGNTVYGGPIRVQGGPWQVAGNQVLGSVQGALTTDAFGAVGGHDITLLNNVVTNNDPANHGAIDRFFVANHSGYGFNLVGNSVSSNVGLIAPVPNGAPAAGTPENPRNEPEEVVFEDYGKIFEGSVTALGVSSSTSATDDRRVISIPNAELALFSGYATTSSWALTLLDGANAGQHIRVIQAFPSATDPTNTIFLLDSALPTGNYDLDIEPAYVNLNFTQNAIDTSGTVSTALVFASTTVDATVTGNTFTGDQSSLVAGNQSLLQSQAIRIDPGKASLSNRYLHASPNSNDDSYNVVQVNISGNRFVNAVGGIKAYVEADNSLATTSGRTYGFVTLTNNQFQYSYADSSIITLGRAGDYSGLINNIGVVYDPSATNFTDPHTIRLTASGNTIQWASGVTPPPTDVVVNAATVNGTLYEANATPALLSVVTTPLSYDFGPANQVVAAGYTPVNERTTYASTQGYGWIDDSGDRNSLIRSGGTDLTNDAVYASYMTFQVDLPDGTYDVTPALGDLSPFAHSVLVSLQGTLVDTVATTAYQVKAPTYVATVTDGHLRIKLQSSPAGTGSDGFAVLEGLSITAQPQPTTPTLSDPGFETIPVGPGRYVYNPTGSAWTFASAGVTGNASGFTWGNPNAPEGGQVAFLQSLGTISQAVTFATGGTYQLSFQAAQRGVGFDYNLGGEDFEVLVDGSVVAQIRPTGTSYQSYTTAAFTVGAGIHTIAFVGLDTATGDNTVFLDAVSLAVATTPSAPSVGDSGFEAVRVGNGYAYNPAGSAWTFSPQGVNTGSGLTGNGSGFTSGNPAAPEGTQVAFLQATGTISQTIAGWGAGTYQVALQAAQRGNYNGRGQDFQVLVDGSVVGQFTPTGTAFQTDTTRAFTVGAGAHTITFQGLDSAGGDNTAFLDAVSIVAASTLAPVGTVVPPTTASIPILQSPAPSVLAVVTSLPTPQGPDQLFSSATPGIGLLDQDGG